MTLLSFDHLHGRHHKRITTAPDHYSALGVGIGAGIGLVVGGLIGGWAIPVGVSFGVGAGVVVGAAIDGHHRAQLSRTLAPAPPVLRG